MITNSVFIQPSREGLPVGVGQVVNRLLDDVQSHIFTVAVLLSYTQLSLYRPPSVPLLPSHAKTLGIQHRIEEQEEAPLRLMPPHRIVREQQEVSLADGSVDQRRAAG